MQRRARPTTIPTLALALAAAGAVALGGCAAETGERRAGLDDALYDPTGPFADDDPPLIVPDAGAADAGPGLGDVPGRDDDRTDVEDTSYAPPFENAPMRCGTEICREGWVCCPATQQCVREGCPNCCDSAAKPRFDGIDEPDPESPPTPDPAGPRPPSDDGADGAPPMSAPEREGPGPMPVGPGAPSA